METQPWKWNHQAINEEEKPIIINSWGKLISIAPKKILYSAELERTGDILPKPYNIKPQSSSELYPHIQVS